MGNFIMRNLTLISATADLNNTRIQCRVEVTGKLNEMSNFTYSNVTILRIQGTFVILYFVHIILFIGLLNMVGDLSYNFINLTSLNVTWSAPYTLDGVDILGYNITITNTSNGNIYHTYFTQNTQYVISNNDGDPCTELTVTISSYNGAGIGDMISFNFFYLGGIYYCCIHCFIIITRC